ncbi:hypothetical protein HPB52_019314 [Rhipicephalus sanguineus]|uniref:Uncharacterized protein n=1 Tax=Rhipicephalus sanguineus TaxID=34632 RepID=A0A9D4T4H3_RHISA|nr:hypothetical protein HPB52_019314 [Rhipicephalus sanguineus]
MCVLFLLALCLLDLGSNPGCEAHFLGTGPEPHVPHQPLPPHGGGGSGFPIRPDNYPPDVGPQQPHGNSPGTGSVPPQPGSGGGGEGSDDGAPCDDECEPGENDSYIHLIDPRRGKN